MDFKDATVLISVLIIVVIGLALAISRFYECPRRQAGHPCLKEYCDLDCPRSRQHDHTR